VSDILKCCEFSAAIFQAEFMDEEDDYEEDYDGSQNVKKRDPIGSFCPTNLAPEGAKWEYLQGRNDEGEIWLKDDIFRINCVG
jgi:hypothetical protein